MFVLPCRYDDDEIEKKVAELRRILAGDAGLVEKNKDSRTG